ncbi:hypothetical protein V6C53_07745 [Desulfocurvibacter africanus]|uniref:Uncharacterized protein n=1 Tax=Desulfocurvibacter africanus subsp. africanus str. Walvis Bay TaxID=690850 RepID=F3Z014_DESAF|nr:hypothetical protein [Desulfocurvibacter africanus]EGJ52043.1 hypothetical protein Desaf_3767 [Desulfocurvibacter africanus subsp. africanus str. Walvis Bay]
MDKLEFVSTFLCIKDVSYEVLEWAESASEEDFRHLLQSDCVMPPEVEDKLERFCEVCKNLHEFLCQYRSVCR